MSTYINFEMREYTRPASDEERAEQLANLLATMNAIDTTRSEAKTKAAEYKAQISNLEDREDDLRQHLEAGTFLEGVEVHAVIDEMSGNTEYYDRAGNLIPQLTHPTTKQERRDEAERRQVKMFGEEPGDSNDTKTPFDIAPLSQADADRADYEKRMEELANQPSNYQSVVDTFEAAASDKASDDLPTVRELYEQAQQNEAELMAEIESYRQENDTKTDGNTFDSADFDTLTNGRPTQLESATSTMQPETLTVATNDTELPKSKTSTMQPPARKNGRFAKRETA